MFALRVYLAALRQSVTPVPLLRAARLWEVDVLRGVAIGMMVVYHLMWDLTSLGGYAIAVRSGFWNIWQIITASLFTTLVGVALTLSYQRERKQHPTGSLWPKYLLRGLVLLTWGVVIGTVTYLALGRGAYVRFGILHLIGLSIILAYPLLRFRWLNLALAVIITALTPLVAALHLHAPWLEWLAATPGSGVDYAPLLPWFGRVLFGVFLGNLVYTARGERHFPLPGAPADPITRTLRLLGQNSLLIYLLHQPLLLIVLTLLGAIRW
ncbi:MAG: heparan-alpha-glucosaminide N-acetyltransferase [Caldilineales bacterium]